MSSISNEEVYTGLNRIYFFTKNPTDIINGGVFDLSSGISLDKYVSGELFEPEIDLFEDNEYNGRECLTLFFKHYLFSFLGFKFGPGHIHEKILISSEPNIPISEMRYQTSRGDIWIFGTPKSLEGRCISDRHGEIKLIEVEPFLNKDEVTEVVNNINAVTVFKKEMVEAKIQAHQYSTEAWLQLSRAVSSEASNITLGTIISSLLKRLDMMTHKLIEMRISTNAQLQSGLEKVEENLDLNVGWTGVSEDENTRMVEGIRSNLNYLTAIKNQITNEPSDQVREYAFNLAVEVCGVEYLKNRLNSDNPQSSPKTSNTLSGLTTNYIKNQIKANATPQEINSANDTMINLLRKYYDAAGGDIKKAISQFNEALSGNGDSMENQLQIRKPPLQPPQNEFNNNYAPITK